MTLKTLLLLPALIVLFGLLAGSAGAHSTAGRIKVDLDLSEPGVDDFAYFIESYVHRQLYDGKFAESRRRFYVREFIGVEHEDRRATVRFLVLDNKNKRIFPDAMNFSRRPDGVWRYRGAAGDFIPVYTYTMRWTYYYRRYILPVSVGGTALGLGLLALLRRGRNRKSGRHSATGNDIAAERQ
ncbi:MAG: hypothetical protein JW781_01130 [Deltaproteobacteria bacterium]|nr:hypothetical protein [Candidatus Anaeroferrophillacea bacterium]